MVVGRQCLGGVVDMAAARLKKFLVDRETMRQSSCCGGGAIVGQQPRNGRGGGS